MASLNREVGAPAESKPLQEAGEMTEIGIPRRQRAMTPIA